MPQIRPTVPGIERSFGAAPTGDPVRGRAIDVGSLFAAGRNWTPLGFSALGHTLTVNPATGGLAISAIDWSIPYYGLPLQILRTLDVQEQFLQGRALFSHPNADPRHHLFGNWQFSREAQVSAAWSHTYPEVLVADGDAGSAVFYRENPTFQMNSRQDVEARLRTHGVPGRTLAALGWQNHPFDLVLRSRQGLFELVAGQFLEESLVDGPDIRLLRFSPTAGFGYRYTSEYAYEHVVDVDGRREATVPVVTSLVVDALGHSSSFVPIDAAPPYRAWRLQDGSARACRFEMEAFATFLDGNRPGREAKMVFVSRAVDETRALENTIRYDYEGARLVRVTLPGHGGGADRVYEYGYDANGALASINDPEGRTLTFTYVEDTFDTDDRFIARLKLKTIADEEGNEIRYKYDYRAGTTDVAFVGPAGTEREVRYHFAEDFTDTQKRYLDRETIQVTRGPTGNQLVDTRTSYSNDGRFLVEALIDPLGNATRFEYNAFNQVSATVDANGHRREYEYDLAAAPSPATPHRFDLLGVHESNVDLAGNPFAVDEQMTYASYDGVSSADPVDVAQSTHRIATRLDPLGELWKFAYSDATDFSPLRPTTLTDPLGEDTARRYNAAGQVTAETDATANTWRWGYNAQGQLISCTDPNNEVSSWVYDNASGWLTHATDALGAAPGDPARSIRYEWTAAGQRQREKDAVGAVTDYDYYSNGRLRSVTRTDAAPRTTTFSFEANGSLRSIQDPRGNSFTLLYDEANRLYEVQRSALAGAYAQFTFDAAGRVTQSLDANGQTIVYTYDPVGRMISLTEPNFPAHNPVNAGKQVHVTYDELGKRLRLTDSQLPGDYTYAYDPAGSLTQRTDPFGGTLGYGHDARGDLIRVSDAGGIIDLRFRRDAAGRLESVRDSSFLDPSRRFRYFRQDGALRDNLYRIEHDASGIVTRFQYDPNRQLAAVTQELGGAPFSAFLYGYHADGLLASINGDRVGKFDYDGIKQLVRETDVALRDAYDAAGNRLWRAAAAPAPADQNAYDNLNRLLKEPSTGTNFQYDANGNLVTRATGAQQTTYTYDGANRLFEVDDGVVRVRYLYDVDGRLLERRAHGGAPASHQRFQYSNQSLLAVTDVAGNVQTLYTRDDEGRLLRRRGAALAPVPTTDPHSLFVLQDAGWNVTRLTDWDGTDHLVSDYDAWGNRQSQPGATTTEVLGYRGAYHDPDTGLIKFGARWYSPDIGRWQSEDPILLGLPAATSDPLPRFRDFANLYQYVLNNPLTLIDPDGLGGVLPKGWPQPPGWKGGYKWENGPGSRLTDPDGNRWHWHPEDEGHHDHWDYEDKRGKRRLDKDGKDLGDDAFKEEEGEKATEESSEKDNTAKKVGFWAAVGIGAWFVAKWTVAVLAAPETGGASLGVAAVTP